MLRNNIILSALLKVIGLVTSLLLVPITLSYLDNEVYGIWMTITSILTWFAFFDIGLGNGMRNYLTQAVSASDYEKGRAYLSTTLCILIAISFLIGLVCIIPLTSLNFNKVFNSYHLSNASLRNAMLIAVFFTLANFVVKNIGYVFVALQKYALNDLLTVSGSVIALIIIYILTKTTEGNLIYVVMAITITPVIIFLLSSVPIFKRYAELRPSFKYFDKSLLKQIIGKGLGFFFIQITSCLVIYGGSNLFITQICGPSSVTVYNIAYKYFNLLAIAYTIVIAPMWNAYTEAYVKGDINWIGRTFNKALKTWGLSIMIGLLMLTVSNIFYHLWVGNAVMIPMSVSICVFAYISFFNFNNCVTYLLNGLNKIRIQIYTSVITTIIYLIVLLLWGNKFNIEGVIICMTISYLIMGLIHFYQCKLLIKRKATGIWDK